jgi:chromosome segregation ATPase
MTMKQSILNYFVITAIALSLSTRSNCQNDLPESFKKDPLSAQLKFLEEHTRIYENYRAIREDIFRVISKNTLDTLKNAKSRISGLIVQTTALNSRIDSLQKSMESSETNLKKATSTKNSIGVLGMEVNKTVYNTVMWTILAGLILLLTIGYLTFKQNRVTTLKTRKELDNLQAEYEDYRTKSRLEREKMNIDHFNEIQKYKGKR